MSRLWDKGASIEETVLHFTVGDDYVWDQRLVAFDVLASIAHAEMLEQSGFLTRDELQKIEEALKGIGSEHAKGQWSISQSEEDCHTALEIRLTERLGALGGKIHLGRSRNDQVMAAIRLYLRETVKSLASNVSLVVDGLEEVIHSQGALAIPGYTHLQRAMPSSVALWAGGFCRELTDDREGLLSTLRRLNINPLGSAAGYGVPDFLNLDREMTTEALEFSETQSPVTAVQLSRGKAESQVAFEVLMLMQDLGRLASDLCLFSTQEFSFVELPEEMTTGSSIMPQKRNPDVFELVRGRSTQILGDLVNIIGLTLKMPSGYHRDLQLIKPPLFRSLDSAEESVRVMAYALPRIRFRRQGLEKAISDDLFATERAYRLVVEQGMSFREAYRRIGAEFRSKP